MEIEKAKQLRKEATIFRLVTYGSMLALCLAALAAFGYQGYPRTPILILGLSLLLVAYVLGRSLFRDGVSKKLPWWDNIYAFFILMFISAVAVSGFVHLLSLGGCRGIEMIALPAIGWITFFEGTNQLTKVLYFVRYVE